MYYHSIDWGFDLEYFHKKNKAMVFLKEHSLTTCISSICGHKDLNMYFHDDRPYLVMVTNEKKRSLKKGYFGICRIEKLEENLKKDYGPDIDWDDFEFCLINQMMETPDCFTATLLSDGNGNIIIEYLKGTVDNRRLTSGGNEPDRPSGIIFEECLPIKCDDYHILLKMYDVIKKCFCLKGYYELSYAMVNGNKDIYFSYYSSDENYLNIFRKERFLFEDELGCRSVFSFLRQAGIIY